jgi:hypothetical protein
VKLINHKGVAHEVDVGLIDKDGCFLLLLDSNEPSRYYRFSDESQALTKLYERNRELEAKVQAYEEQGAWKADRGLVPQHVAAKLLGLSGNEVRELLDTGQLRSEKRWGNRKVPLSAIEQYQVFMESQLAGRVSG